MIPFDIPDLVVHETIGGSETQRRALLALYAEIFPAYAYYLPYMDYKMRQTIDHDPAFIERWWLLEIDGAPAALALFKYSPAHDLSFNLTTAVHPNFRKFSVAGHERLVTFLLDAMERQTHADAAAHERPQPTGMIAEFQTPEADMTAEEKQWHLHVMKRFRGMGYLEMPIAYREPPYIFGSEALLAGVEPSDMGFHDMILTIKPTTSAPVAPTDHDVMQRSALMILVDHYKLPHDHWVVQLALQSIAPYGRTA